MAVLTCTHIFLVLGMLLLGSINTLLKKAQNDCSARGLKDEHGKEIHKFDHPWFQTVLMFIGESLCLIGLYFYRRHERYQTEKSYHAVVNGNRDEPHTQQPRVFQWILAFPTICNVFGTTLEGIGLLHVSASVWQMLRGSIIIFTGILSSIFLKRKLWPIHWIGIIVTMAGLVLVGLSSILRENHQGASRGQVILGIVLILSAQCVTATQMIVEEIFLKKRNFLPLQVVGIEGIFGVFFMCVVVLPVVYYIPGDQHHNSYENSLDALVMIKNDHRLAIFSALIESLRIADSTLVVATIPATGNSKKWLLQVLYICSISFYSFFGLSVIKSLTAVHRTLIDACRTIVVWLVDLFVYYAIRDKGFGEAFDKRYGIFQVDGFLFLLLGTALYNELLRIPPLMPKPQANPSPEQPQVQASDEPDTDESEPLIKESDLPGSYTGGV